MTVTARVTAAAVTVAMGATVIAARQQAQFSGGTDLVILHVVATGRDGRHVAGLGRNAFTVLEDGVPQTITLFSNEDIPATVGLVIDSSISMWSIHDVVVAAATEFARASNPDDELFALAFNDSVQSALPNDRPFTSDPDVLERALFATVTARGRTALFDAIDAGLAYTARGTHPRKVLVLFSDGGDNASRTSLDNVVARTQASNVVIYTVALLDPTARDANPDLLERLARSTGGRATRPDTQSGRSKRAISQALEDVARDIRHSYTLGYVPNRSPDGTFRRLDIRVMAQDRQRVTVRARQGYLATQPAAATPLDLEDALAAP
jgi:Ca-activated chloride channel family protein